VGHGGYFEETIPFPVSGWRSSPGRKLDACLSAAVGILVSSECRKGHRCRVIVLVQGCLCDRDSKYSSLGVLSFNEGTLLRILRAVEIFLRRNRKDPGIRKVQKVLGARRIDVSDVALALRVPSGGVSVRVSSFEGRSWVLRTVQVLSRRYSA